MIQILEDSVNFSDVDFSTPFINVILICTSAEEWITEETWEEIGRRKDCKKMTLGENCQVTQLFLQNQYKEIDKSVKHKTRREKNIHR